MRRLLGALLIILHFSADAQIKYGFHYKIKNEYSLGGDFDIFYVDNTSNTVANKRTYKVSVPNVPANIWRLWAGKSLKANVTQDDNGWIKFEFWSIPPGSSYDIPGSHSVINSQMNRGLFYTVIHSAAKILEPPKFYISIPYVVTELGAITLPFKYRFGYRINDTLSAPNDATGSVNVGFYVSRKWGRTRFFSDKSNTYDPISFSLAAFAGPAVIDISEDNTFPKAKVKSNELGASLGAGFLLNYNDFNFGIFWGTDIGFSGAVKDWMYHGKSWIGLAIGYKLTVLN